MAWHVDSQLTNSKAMPQSGLKVTMSQALLPLLQNVMTADLISNLSMLCHYAEVPGQREQQ